MSAWHTESSVRCKLRTKAEYRGEGQKHIYYNSPLQTDHTEPSLSIYPTLHLTLDQSQAPTILRDTLSTYHGR